MAANMFRSCLVIIALVHLLAACNEPEPVQKSKIVKPQPAPMPISARQETMQGAVELTVVLNGMEVGKPIVSGQTNLPSQTSLMISIDSEDGFTAQAKAAVVGGRYQAGPFSDKGNGLKTGRYKANVMTPAMFTQPPSVQAILGKKGEKLTGSLVQEDNEMGLGRMVEANSSFFIGKSVDAAKKAEGDRKAELREILGKLRTLQKQGIEMDPLRQSSDEGQQMKCIDLMRKRLPVAEELERRLEDFPVSIKVSFGSAAIRAKMCVTCRTSVMAHCELMTDDLNLAARTLKDMR